MFIVCPLSVDGVSLTVVNRAQESDASLRLRACNYERENEIPNDDGFFDK